MPSLTHRTPDGVRYHATRLGRPGAPAVLLLHGFTGSSATWAPLQAELADTLDLIAVDLLGHGRSDAPADPARYAAGRCADDLAGLLDALGLTTAAVVGYSMGGRMALRLALDWPERVRALLLESASPGIADAAERAARLAADAALAAEIERDGVPAFVDRWERLPLWASQAALPAEVRAALRAQRLRNDARGLADSLRGAGAGAEPPVLSRLGALRMPALLVAGALDARYVAHARAMAERMPAARVEVVPDAGHAVHLEQPATFTALVRRAAT
ncbi:MAG TPA: 2-succinyl-6-hydroxy-2,4-cyclohexadiene-1-carboxylate synthase [Gemmatimonadaceae bacterium]|nr:2-succinyl-6-hydroxy-2,4-cyclohexadiene-1-carboxylate synthase [Gemmatimonadaceae bacterium]